MLVVVVEFDITPRSAMENIERSAMENIEIYDTKENLLMAVEAPFLPLRGEYISIEKDNYFKYYRVEERWLRISQDKYVTGCVCVVLED